MLGKGLLLIFPDPVEWPMRSRDSNSDARRNRSKVLVERIAAHTQGHSPKRISAADQIFEPFSLISSPPTT